MLEINVATLKNQMTRNIIPDAETAVKISQALGISVEYLVTGAENDSAKKELSALKAKLLELATS